MTEISNVAPHPPQPVLTESNPQINLLPSVSDSNFDDMQNGGACHKISGVATISPSLSDHFLPNNPAFSRSCTRSSSMRDEIMTNSETDRIPSSGFLSITFRIWRNISSGIFTSRYLATHGQMMAKIKRMFAIYGERFINSHNISYLWLIMRSRETS